MCKIHASLIVFLFLITGVVGIPRPPLAEGAGPSTSSYINRALVSSEYNSDEDVVIKVKSYYSVDAQRVDIPCPVNASIYYSINGSNGEYIRSVSVVCDDSRLHRMNFGRLSQATYNIVITFPSEIKKESFCVLHPPVKYSIALNNGKCVDFRSEEKNKTFTVHIDIQYGLNSVESHVFYNRSELVYDVPGSPQILSIYVVDEYGNINAGLDGDAYTWDYSKPPSYYFYRDVSIVVLVLLSMTFIVFVIRRSDK